MKVPPVIKMEISVHKYQNEFINAVIYEGLVKSKSEFIRNAIDDKIERMQEQRKRHNNVKD